MILNINKIDFYEKLTKLLDSFGNSSKLAEKIGVSRTSIVNWQDNTDSIRDHHRMDIDVLYCDKFVTPELSKIALPDAILLPDNYKIKNAIIHLRHFAYGTYEIEDSTADRETFDRLVEHGKTIPKGVSREAFIGMLNSLFVTQQIWKRIIDNKESIEINESLVRSLHSDLTRMLRDDAGYYAKNIRVMGKLDGIDTTDPDDIGAEVAYWCSKYKNTQSLQNVAESHAHFIRIHPFGDGNGRVGRALMLIQCLQAGLMPPILSKSNQALYYSTMAYAMRHGQHAPLTHLLLSAQYI